VNSNDFTNCVLSYGVEVAYLPKDMTFCGVFDFNIDGKIVGSDFTEFVLAYGSKANRDVDSFYKEEPPYAVSNAVLASEIETEAGVFSLVNPSEVAAASQVARRAAVDAALIAELSASEDDEENAATTAVAAEAVATQNADEAADERAALVETFAAVGSATETDFVWAFDADDEKEDAFAFDVDLNVEF
ncbi:MAG: hypothetical protein IJZ10_05955, partial [Thermoguttaceae bacterium]|nr:hypothetical protein [Thermoguttaceae bacterium]